MIEVGSKFKVTKGSLKNLRIDKGTVGVVKVVTVLGADYSYAVRLDVIFTNGFLGGKGMTLFARHKNRLADNEVALKDSFDRVSIRIQRVTP